MSPHQLIYLLSVLGAIHFVFLANDAAAGESLLYHGFTRIGVCTGAINVIYTLGAINDTDRHDCGLRNNKPAAMSV